MNTAANTLKTFWDQRYENTDYIFGKAPNDYLVQQCQNLKPLSSKGSGRALCLADGEGRNGVWLASKGWQVRGIDISSAGIDKAKKLALETGVAVDFEVCNVKDFHFTPSHYQLITSIFFHLPKELRKEIHQRCINSLEIGGILVLESYSPEQLGQNTGGPKELELLVSLKDVIEDFPDCEILHQYTGPRDVVEGIAHKGAAFVTQLTIRKIK
jgi:hypothetical protein